MNPHFFTAPFYFGFIWFRVQGSRFRVQGSGFRVQDSGGGFAANIPMTIHAAFFLLPLEGVRMFFKEALIQPSKKGSSHELPFLPVLYSAFFSRISMNCSPVMVSFS